MRPKLISILCVVFFFIGTLGILGWIISYSRGTLIHPIIPLFRYIGMLVTSVALWKMMKWAYFFYLAVFLLMWPFIGFYTPTTFIFCH